MPDHVDKFESRTRGVHFDIKSELKQLITNSSEVALETKESSPCLANNVITETINNTYRQPIDSDVGATGTVIEEDCVPP